MGLGEMKNDKKEKKDRPGQKKEQKIRKLEWKTVHRGVDGGQNNEVGNMQKKTIPLRGDH